MPCFRLATITCSRSLCDEPVGEAERPWQSSSASQLESHTLSQRRPCVPAPLLLLLLHDLVHLHRLGAAADLASCRVPSEREPERACLSDTSPMPRHPSADVEVGRLIVGRVGGCVGSCPKSKLSVCLVPGGRQGHRCSGRFFPQSPGSVPFGSLGTR